MPHPALKPALLGLLLLAGCERPEWVPGPGMNAAGLESAKARCAIWARNRGGFSAAIGSPLFVGAAMLGQGIAGAVRTNSDENDCMLAAGWRRAAPEPGGATPASAPATAQAKPSAAPANAAVAPAPAPTSATASGPVTLTGREGRLRMTLPAGWQVREAPPVAAAAEFYALNNGIDALVVVSATANADVQDFDRYLASVRDTQLGSTMTEVEKSEPQELRINGRRAVRIFYGGVARTNGVRYRLVFTAIQGERQVIKVNALTTQSRFEQNRAALEGLAQGVSEVPAGG